MNLREFKEASNRTAAPAGLNPYLQALWHDVKGEWDAAHHLVQDIPTREAAWVHAYLHRKEGDSGNALYWYSRAGKNFSRLSLEEEWEELAAAFLKINPLNP